MDALLASKGETKMSGQIYFSACFHDAADAVLGGVAVRIPKEQGRLPGERIRALTDAARSVSLGAGEALRTEILVAPPANLATAELSAYLWGDGSMNADRFGRHLEAWRKGKAPEIFLPQPGVPVLGAGFLGRQEPLRRMTEALRGARSCHLRAPRRYGKTSLLMRLAGELPQSVMMELSDIGSLAGFLKVMLRAAMRHDRAWSSLMRLEPYRSWPGSGAASAGQSFNAAFKELHGSYANALPALLRETFAALADEGIVLLIDEFSVFLRSLQEAGNDDLQNFAGIFRELRGRPSNPLAAVVAGSSGLSTYIQFYGLQARFDDLLAVDVPPIAAGEARLLAEEIFYAMGKSPTRGVVERIVELTGQDDTIPYFVHALVHVTAEEAGPHAAVTEAHVESAYLDRLLGPSGNIFFRDFILRERAYPAEYHAGASKVLQRLTGSFPDPVAFDELKSSCLPDGDLRKLMTCLQEDYDLVEQAGAWRMRSRLLADRWRVGEPWLTLGGAA